MSELPQRSDPPEHSVPQGLSRFIPSRLQALFSRNRQTQSTKSLAQGSEHGLVGKADHSPIHPDIEEGARHILEEELVRMVRIGSTAGIEVGIRALGKAWIQAQKAAGATFELTFEGRQEIPWRVREICAQHISEGLAQKYSVTGFLVGAGREQSITDGPQSVAELFQVADEFQIPLSYLPAKEGVQPTGNTLAVLITTSEQALAHMQEVIDRNLPRGIHGIIESLGVQVGKGLLRDLPDYEQRIERWVDIMEQRGWTVVDQPVNATVEGEAQPGLLPRQVNRAEIRQLVDQAIRYNLAKGARNISEMVGFGVKSGWFNPLQTWGTLENIALYTKAGEKYGLTHFGGITVENGGMNPDLYFDPRELPRHIKEAVKRNLPDGLRTIEARHLQNVREGSIGQIELGERTLEQYVQLAEEYEVHINPDNLRQKMTEHVTVDNLKQGVRARMIAVRDALRKANYNGVSVYTKEAEEFRRFVHERGFGRQIDFSELDQYLEQTATQAPRLTERASEDVLE